MNTEVGKNIRMFSTNSYLLLRALFFVFKICYENKSCDFKIRQ